MQAVKELNDRLAVCEHTTHGDRLSHRNAVPATAANPNGKEYSTQVQFSTADTPAAFGQPGSTLAPAPIAENSGYNGSAPSSSAGACMLNRKHAIFYDGFY